MNSEWQTYPFRVGTEYFADVNFLIKGKGAFVAVPQYAQEQIDERFIVFASKNSLPAWDQPKYNVDHDAGYLSASDGSLDLDEEALWYVWIGPFSNMAPEPWLAAAKYCATGATCQDPCGGACGRAAYCSIETKKCLCGPGFDRPPKCEVRLDDSTVCPNDCSGKGTCSSGVCVCDEGRHGADCSLSNEQPLSTGTIAAILGAVFGVLLIGGLVAAGIVFYRRAKKRSVHYAGSPADLRLDDNQSSDGAVAVFN
eukprot:CAMPEP_0168597976 /NCGR_PEP_ID=MMETSP0420-20121227/11067_1 /TAXON_ID=498008 /ORGANISM="Pessonella sp." /LENGTH=253 /DNA_ID=CAMNT_0008635095 /DNA_START=185 /DNA_END=944 /DNA_ORIENTATION=+